MLDRAALTTGALVREAARRGELADQTSGLAPGFTQANLVILPAEAAAEFLQFCQRNPQPCPLLDVTAPGDPRPLRLAPAADLRTDVPRYRVWKQGELVAEPTDIRHLWQPDFVGFLLGCSFTFEQALEKAGVPVRHLERGCNVPMFRTTVPCTPAGRFAGPLVVSMRPMTPAQAIRAIQITSRFPAVHGAPVHLGFPEAIGIRDLARPDFGDAVPMHPGELPVFWACGVTPQSVIMASRPPLVITHSPGCMFVSDIPDSQWEGQELPMADVHGAV